MKKIIKVLIIINIIFALLIFIKLAKQKKNYEYIISDYNMTLDEAKYELEREIEFGEKSYAEFADGKRINVSEEFKKDIVLQDELKVKDFHIEYSDGFTLIQATVANESSEEKGGYYAYLNLFNDQNEKILPLKVYINVIEPNSQTVLSTGINADISSVYKCEIEKIEEENADE